MNKYIPADKVLSEIERLEHENCMSGGEHFCMRRAICLGNLRNIVAHPYHEQEEADLEKIIGQTYHDGSVADTSDMDLGDYENIARHFFELGINTIKEE